MKKKLRTLLYRSLDRELPAVEQQQLEQALEAFPELRRERERLMALRQMLSAEPAPAFKPFFAARVMRRLRQSNAGEELASLLPWAFRRVALAGAVALMLLIANQVVIEKERTLDAVLNTPQWSLNETVQLDFVIVE